MAKRKSKSAGGEKVFVRGPDGSLYILSKDKPPYKLNPNDMKIVRKIMNDVRIQVGKSLKIEAPNFGSMVNITIPGIHILP